MNRWSLLCLAAVAGLASLAVDMPGVGDAPLRILSLSTRPAMENLGLVLTQHGENADYA